MTKQEGNDKVSYCQVVIVGAGVSGLQCAQSLVANGGEHLNYDDVMILEARNRIGGRVHTRQQPCPSADEDFLWVDNGAAWVHGIDPVAWESDGEDDQFHVVNDKGQLENPVLKYLDAKTELNRVAKGNPWMRPFAVMYQTQNLAVYIQQPAATQGDEPRQEPFAYLTKKKAKHPQQKNDNRLIESSVRRHYEIMRSVAEQINDMYKEGRGMEANAKISLWSSLETSNQQHELHGTLNKENERSIVLALTSFHQHLITTWQGFGLQEIPLGQYGGDEDDSDDEEDALQDDQEFEQDGDFGGPHCTVRGGMQKVVQALCTPELRDRIQLNQEVVRIQHVANSKNEETAKEEEKYMVRVETKDGSIIYAKSCVVTIPVGPLKENHPTLFADTTPLSEQKLEALQLITMGRYKKVFLSFDGIFWPAEPAFLGLVLQDGSSPLGTCLLIDNIWAKDGHACMEAVLAGDQAVWGTHKPDDVIRDAVLEFLDGAMNVSSDDEQSAKQRCVDCHVTRWEEDPYCRGAFTGLAIGGLNRHIEAYREPEWDGCLRFAGDASSFEFEGSVPSAIMSGKFTARGILELLGFEQKPASLSQGEGAAGKRITQQEQLPETPIYDEYNWSKLPAKVKEAAQVLGYNKSMWDRDKEPAISNKSWRRLTPGQQYAASVLGYTRELWDAA